MTTNILVDDEWQIVALNVEQFGPGYPGEYCYKSITISYNGQNVQATITDKVCSTLMSIICSLIIFCNIVHGMSLGWPWFLPWFVWRLRARSHRCTLWRMVVQRWLKLVQLASNGGALCLLMGIFQSANPWSWTFGSLEDGKYIPALERGRPSSSYLSCLYGRLCFWDEFIFSFLWENRVGNLFQVAKRNTVQFTRSILYILVVLPTIDLSRWTNFWIFNFISCQK